VRLTRRSLIRGLLLILGVDPAGRWTRDVAAQPVAPDAPSSPAPLSNGDVDDLLAFAEVLVDDTPMSSAARRDIRDRIEDRIKQAPDHYLALHRTTLTLLTRLGRARFSSLTPAERIALVAQHRLGSSRVWPDEELGPYPEEAREVRTRAVPELVGAYYRSAAGWAVVGYDAFPGRCSDLARYTAPGR
jgi:hypothetical protein